LLLSGTRVSDGVMDRLKDLTGLQTLFLDDTFVTDAGLVGLKHLPELRKLLLPGASTDASLANLEGLKHLEELGVSRTQITDAGLVHLWGLKKLRKLHLYGTRIRGEGIGKLRAALPEAEVGN
jgi:Leucine Rich repeat